MSALSLVVTGLTTGAIAGGGLGEVIVQRQGRLGRYINAATWLGGLSAVVATVLILLAAPLAALVYEEPDVIGLLVVIALGVPLQGLAVAPRGVLMAQLRFGIYGLLVSVQAMATMLLTIGLALAAALMGLALAFWYPWLVLLAGVPGTELGEAAPIGPDDAADERVDALVEAILRHPVTPAVKAPIRVSVRMTITTPRPGTLNGM